MKQHPKEDKVQRLVRLSRIDGNHEFEAYMEFKRDRAYHFMRKMYRFTQLAIEANQGAK